MPSKPAFSGFVRSNERDSGQEERFAGVAMNSGVVRSWDALRYGWCQDPCGQCQTGLEWLRAGSAHRPPCDRRPGD